MYYVVSLVATHSSCYRLAVGPADYWCSTSDGAESRFWHWHINPPSRCSRLRWRKFVWAKWLMQVPLSFVWVRSCDDKFIWWHAELFVSDVRLT